MSGMGIHQIVTTGRRRIGDLFGRHQREQRPAGRHRELIGEFMRRRVFKLRNAVLRHLAAPGFALLIGIGAAAAQSGDSKAQDQSGKPAAAK